MKKIVGLIGTVLFYLMLVFCFLAVPLTKWFNNNFGITFTEIIYTLTSPLKGANIDAFKGPIAYAVFVVIFCAVLMGLLVRLARSIFDRMEIRLLIGANDDTKIRFDLRAGVILIAGVALVAYSLYSASFIDQSLGVRQYFQTRNYLTTIYEDCYIDPDLVSITLKKDMDKPKNLIYIYLESMETSYAKNGINYIPGLTELVAENISFSDNQGLGGFHSSNGTGWTIAAILASQSGVAFAFPAGYENSMNERAAFAPGLTTMGDILEEKGYYQEFLCGSDIKFAGRDKLFEHGNFEIYDYFNAIDDGYAEASDREFWGIDDSVLYQIAKDQLTEMSKLDQPFNLTMLTLDTHFPAGYVCDLCEDEYDEQYANVVACADRQICDFVEWCKAQDFYKDTVIVISGDHPFMGTTLVEGVSETDRTVYNCFINADAESDLRNSNRVFTSLDMFPTTMSALGFSIEGDKLGLGTNMFSDLDTLAEEKGLDYVNQAAGASKYYLGNFN